MPLGSHFCFSPLLSLLCLLITTSCGGPVGSLLLDSQEGVLKTWSDTLSKLLFLWL